jgi:uncharacterized protein YndB with AHSA1/START domain
VDLPRIDAHVVEVEAPPEDIWNALTDWMARGSSNPRITRFARVLGCEQVKTSGNPGETGSTFPGFRVARADPPRQLALEGGHRFSEYTLDFQIEDRGNGRSSLHATTHAAFPGLKGQLYKTAVIRSRAHVLATKRLLKSVAKRAQRARLDR